MLKNLIACLSVKSLKLGEGVFKVTKPSMAPESLLQFVSFVTIMIIVNILWIIAAAIFKTFSVPQTWKSSDQFPVAHSDRRPYSVIEWAAGHPLAHRRVHRVNVVKNGLPWTRG